MKTIKRIIAAFIAIAMIVSAPIPAFAEGTKTNLVSMHESGSDWVEIEEEGITDSYGNKYNSMYSMTSLFYLESMMSIISFRGPL